jgi:hypothetical protein
MNPAFRVQIMREDTKPHMKRKMLRAGVYQTPVLFRSSL